MLSRDLWRTLAVDDEPDNLDLLVQTFEWAELPLDVATDGETGLRMIHDALSMNNPYNIMLFDIQMPRLSGTVLLDQISTEIDLAQATVIALTAHAMKGDRQKYLSAGFHGYIAKPISILTLLSEIESIVQFRYTTRG